MHCPLTQLPVSEQSRSERHTAPPFTHRFDLGTRDILATSDNDVLGAVEDVAESFVIQRRNVSRGEPTFAIQRLGRLVRLVEVLRVGGEALVAGVGAARRPRVPPSC